MRLMIALNQGDILVRAVPGGKVMQKIKRDGVAKIKNAMMSRNSLLLGFSPD